MRLCESPLSTREYCERMDKHDGLAEMSIPVRQDEPRCVADAAPAIVIPWHWKCETVTVHLACSHCPRRRECRMGERLGETCPPVRGSRSPTTVSCQAINRMLHIGLFVTATTLGLYVE
jgi:hypothetical protein